MERMRELVDILNKARKSYYSDSFEIMSDFEYDKLYDELLDLENKLGVILSNSPTIEVGYEVVSELKKVKHDEKMLSLDKTKDIGKLAEFLEDKKGLLSFKLDGLTIVLKYKDGKLDSAVTRGNGEIGEDITHNFKVFENVPLNIPYKDELILRGEAVISFENFEKINENLDIKDRYKNPRNLCSGSVRQLNSEITNERKVNFLAFSLVKCSKEFTLKSSQLDFLDSLGFDTVSRKIVSKDDIKETVLEFEKNIENNKFATDGLVLTIDDIAYSKSLGTTSKFPKDSIAFKWADDLETTTLLEVEWNTSRTGLITPVAIFEPVELEGTTVNRASLHNVSIIKNLKLGIGDSIKVYKANMIIPQIAENITKSDTLEIPKVCPDCSEKAEIVQIRDGLALKCTNPDCIAKIINSIVHYVSREAMNIADFSKATIEKFVRKGFLNTFFDIYNLKDYKDEILAMEGFGERSFAKLIDAIESSKNVSLPNFIYALGIEHIGLSNAKILSKTFGSIDAIKGASLDDFIAINGFGETMASSVYSYFKDEKNIKLVDSLVSILNFEIIEKEETSTSLDDKIFVITGKLEHFKNRKELVDKIESLNGKVASSISKNTSYLINNDLNSNSSKNKKAKELGISIISEQDFLNLIK